MPTGTKIAAIVLVVLLGAAGLYYAFVPPAPAPKFDPTRSGDSRVTDPLSKPSTLPPSGAVSSAPGGTQPGSTQAGSAGPGIDALAGRAAESGAGAPSTGASGVGSAPFRNGFQNGFRGGPGNAVPPGALAATGSQPNTANTPDVTGGTSPGVGSTGVGSTGVGSTGVGSSGTPATNTTRAGGGVAGTVATGPGLGGTNVPNAPSAAGSESVYVVKKGDSYQSISKSVYGTTSRWKAIADANPNVPEKNMKIGAKLRIPAAPAAVSSENTLASSGTVGSPAPARKSATTPTVAAATTTGSHVIAKGETFSSLARAYYGDSKYWKVIANANPKVDAKSMAVGTKLAIPPKSSVTTAANVDR